MLEFTCGESKRGRISEAWIIRISHLFYLAELAIIQVPGGLGDISDLLAESVKKRNILFIIIYMQIYIREESDYIEDGRRL
jgi:hypothetical protein